MEKQTKDIEREREKETERDEQRTPWELGRGQVLSSRVRVTRGDRQTVNRSHGLGI